MHSRKFDDVVFLYNSDLSGDVIIRRLDETGNTILSAIEVPGDALIDFVAAYVRGARIAEIEQMTAEVVLGLRAASIAPSPDRTAQLMAEWATRKQDRDAEMKEFVKTQLEAHGLTLVRD